VRLGDSGSCPNAGRLFNAHWCGLCYSNIRGRTNAKGHVGFRSLPSLSGPIERFIVRKPVDLNGSPSTSSGACPDEGWKKKYPTIVEYLTCGEWEEGGKRELSNLTVSIGDGCFLLALNDKECHRSLYTQAESLTEGLRLMEGVLAGGKAPWRAWKNVKKK